jgi:Ca2+-binding RTX toxin-like protein
MATITGTPGDDSRSGAATADLLSGLAGNDTLLGLDNNDTLDGGPGADSLVGGAGDDIYVVDDAQDIVSESGGSGLDTVKASLSFDLGNGTTVLGSVENLTLTGTGAIDGTGNALGNAILGNAGNNDLSGQDGADTLTGGAGNDTLDGGFLLGGTLDGHADQLSGGTGNDTYIVETGLDTVTESQAGAAGGIDTVIADNGTDVSFTLGLNLENLELQNSVLNGTGNALNNKITGDDNANKLFGLDGNDTLDGGAGLDSLDGGKGNDTYVVDDQNDLVIESVSGAAGGLDTVLSSASFFTLRTMDNVENLTLIDGGVTGVGNSLANKLTGNGLDNTLSGLEGNDTMAGGLGNDSYVVEEAGDVVIEAADAGIDTVGSTIAYTLGVNLENLQLLADVGKNPDMSGTGNALKNEIDGSTGNNLLKGLAGDDTLNGDLGNDTLDGGTGGDKMAGGQGNDVYIFDNVGDTATEGIGAGIDEIRTSIALGVALDNIENYTFTGATAVNFSANGLGDHIIATAKNDTLTGGVGNDTLDGAGGADSMVGGKGNDTYVIDNVGDKISELGTDAGDTVVSKFAVDLTLPAFANIENATLTGTAVINATGTGAANHLIGNDGANQLDGGLGNDTLEGGKGNDTYVVDASDSVIESVSGAAGGIDTILSSVGFVLGDNIENLTLTGTGDILGTGNALANKITGNVGANEIDGGAGADTMAGGDGNDAYFVDNKGDVVTEAAGAGIDSVDSSVSFVLGANVENLQLDAIFGGDINGTGNGFANNIVGNFGNNVLNGLAGDDTMTGLGGNDTYVVDSTADVIDESFQGGGRDLVQSSVSFDLNANGTTVLGNVEDLTLTGSAALAGTGNALANAITGNSGSNTLTGNDGDDTLDGGAGADSMVGGKGNDTYVIDNAGDKISETGSDSGDTVQSKFAVDLTLPFFAGIENATLAGTAAINATGNAGANHLIGSDGANKLDGGAGNDTLEGGKGSDTYVVDSTTDQAFEALNGAAGGIDTVLSSAAAFTLGFSIENLILLDGGIQGFGNDLGNKLTGNAADNFLNGLAGADTMIGGDGGDIYTVDNAGDVVTEAAGAAGGSDTVLSSVSYALGVNVERLHLSGAGDINATGNSLDNDIVGNSGSNILDGRAGADHMQGLGGNDTYVVDNAKDVIDESTGTATDLVQSSVSFDLHANGTTVLGDIENLTLTGSAAIDGTGNALNNIITGNAGANHLFGGGGFDNLHGGGGNDTLNDVGNSSFSNLFGDAGNDSLIAGDHGDQLDGGSGADHMVGGAGNDSYVVDNVGDVITEGLNQGFDSIQSSVSFTLPNNVENISVLDEATNTSINFTGNALGNELDGNAGKNILSGGDGIDILNGLEGNDTLIGGAGDDFLGGEAGADLIDTSSGHDTAFYQDVVEAGDVVQGFATSGSEQDFVDLDELFDNLGVAAADRAARVSFVDTGPDVQLRIDTDGDHVADLTLLTFKGLPDASGLTVGTAVTDDIQVGT